MTLIDKLEDLLKQATEEIADLKKQLKLNANMLTRQEAVAYVCSERFEQAMRVKGWLHKDDPVERLIVWKASPDIPAHMGYIKPVRPFTVGEALEMLPEMIDSFEFLNSCSPPNTIGKDIAKRGLTTKDGGRIVRERDETIQINR